MNITLTGLWALRVMRMVRRGEVEGSSLNRRVSLSPADSSPRKRWSAASIDLSAFGIAFDEKHPLTVAVPSAAGRLRMRNVTNTVYSRGLPEGSFIDVGHGVCIPCPELLFIELASVMDAPVHVLLGLELCGRFARDSRDPRDGDVAYGLEPLTSADKIRAFIASCKSVRDLAYAAERAQYVMDNAWSPMEAILATVMRLPYGEFGYDLGPLVLNGRVDAPERLVPYVEKASRVPDIVLEGTRVGVNYDGEIHLDLTEIVRRAAAGEDVDEAVERVREKYVDDRRRDRELLMQGYYVLPATSEDLYRDGGLDKLIGQVIELAEQTAGLDLGPQRRMIEFRKYSKGRQRVIWSLLPGVRGRELARKLAGSSFMTFELVAEETIYL